MADEPPNPFGIKLKKTRTWPPQAVEDGAAAPVNKVEAEIAAAKEAEMAAKKSEEEAEAAKVAAAKAAEEEAAAAKAAEEAAAAKALEEAQAAAKAAEEAAEKEAAEKEAAEKEAAEKEAAAAAEEAAAQPPVDVSEGMPAAPPVAAGSYMEGVRASLGSLKASDDAATAIGAADSSSSSATAPAPAPAPAPPARAGPSSDPSSASASAPLPSVRLCIKQVRAATMMAAAHGDDERPEKVGILVWMSDTNGELSSAPRPPLPVSVSLRC
jgi:hypothetical protein